MSDSPRTSGGADWRPGWSAFGAFADRRDAGRRLGARLAGLGLGPVVVLGLPRGGVPVAVEVANALGAPLDAIIVRKLGIPFQPEVAMGAIGEEGVRVVDTELVARLGIDDATFGRVEATERAVLDARVESIRRIHPRLDLLGRTALIVDDGIATGATATAACRVARRLGASRVIVAAPVGSSEAIRRIEDADKVLCLFETADFGAVGAYYRRFDQTSDAEVATLLRASSAPSGART